jgi:hypothetical protein
MTATFTEEESTTVILGKVIFAQFIKHQQNIYPATVQLEPKYVG